MIELQKFELCYLATPYKKYPRGPEMAFIDAVRLAARLMQSGVHVYSPIAHGHPLSVHGGITPHDLSVWNLWNFKMARRMDALIVAMMDGWDRSEGIADEIHVFKADSKPIFYLDPNSMVTVLHGRAA